MSLQFIYKSIIPKIKKILGIKDISLLQKKIYKRFGKLIYHRKYTTKDIIYVMQELGMTKGSIVCIHSSMMQFYNYTGTAQQLIEQILEVIGPEGTLMMPAFPKIKNKDYNQYIFDPKNDPTGAGYLAETFRRYPNVKRSLNVHHSVCAIGKYADYLIRDHHKGNDCWDKKSPWYRLCELNGLVFNFGLPRSYMGTFHHCVESLLKEEHPYWKQFFDHVQKFRYYTPSGEINEYFGEEGSLLRKTRKQNVMKYFTDNEWKIKRLSNLEIKVFYSSAALNKMLELGRKGISPYIIPSTKGYNFE